MAVPPKPALYPSSNDAATSAAIALLIHYFDLAPASAQLLVKKWLASHPAIWVRAAVTEALYQGRYKPVSVEQILSFWQRRGRSIVHFNKEFEALIAVPLQGGFKTETDVAIEGNGSSGQTIAEPMVADLAVEQQNLDSSQALGLDAVQGDSNWVAAPDMTLAEAFDASAEQDQFAQDQPGVEQLAPSSEALPCPRLMLPGELPGKDLVSPAKDLGNNSHEPSGVAAPNPQAAHSSPAAAMLPGAKSQPIQPPPIGRFTPASDPSGFASRLKTVVQQAVAQTQAGEAQLSLETAIAGQLASDPVLGQLSSIADGENGGHEADSAIEMSEVVAPFADRFAMTSATDSTSKTERSAVRDELDLELDALALDSVPPDSNSLDSDPLDSNPPDSDKIGAPDLNGLDSASGLGGDNSLPGQTTEPPSQSAEIADVSKLMAGLTASEQSGTNEITLSLDNPGMGTGVSNVELQPLPKEDEKTGSD